ncbi:hypothetical protein THAOC_15289 [Thalassiosira oceanica]|uniref:Uncharacterized protein n=1 Tax=Thalassiosira oceanica TaxID=159749 RepID=K0SSK9_THAOC|nr:hypothetical protein THAOC_15289 [Thalassiosira oceanica]|eukprot:EJK64021.1 hypothetical protein THAOC_15289 [Thalassiosira oceanica]
MLHPQGSVASLAARPQPTAFFPAFLCRARTEERSQWAAPAAGQRLGGTGRLGLGRGSFAIHGHAVASFSTAGSAGTGAVVVRGLLLGAAATGEGIRGCGSFTGLHPAPTTAPGRPTRRLKQPRSSADWLCTARRRSGSPSGSCRQRPSRQNAHATSLEIRVVGGPGREEGGPRRTKSDARPGTIMARPRARRTRRPRNRTPGSPISDDTTASDSSSRRGRGGGVAAGEAASLEGRGRRRGDEVVSRMPFNLNSDDKTDFP